VGQFLGNFLSIGRIPKIRRGSSVDESFYLSLQAIDVKDFPATHPMMSAVPPKPLKSALIPYTYLQYGLLAFSPQGKIYYIIDGYIK